MSDERPDFRRGIDWAKVRAAAAQQHFAQLLDQRKKITLTSVAGIAAGAALLAVFAVWIWIY